MLAALGAGRGQQQQREALELAPHLPAVGAELVDVALVEIALFVHLVGHTLMVWRQTLRRTRMAGMDHVTFIPTTEQMAYTFGGAAPVLRITPRRC